jgi:hypothetical protein
MKVTGLLPGLLCLVTQGFVKGREATHIENSPVIHGEHYWGLRTSSKKFEFVSQTFIASTTWLFPTYPFIRPSPSLAFYRLEVCERVDIKPCMIYGAWIGVKGHIWQIVSSVVGFFNDLV